MTKVELCSRRFGVHTPFKTATIPAPLDALVRWQHEEHRGEVPVVDEDALLAALPSGFLPGKPSAVLLLVDGTAVGEPKRFRVWGKYFDSLSLNLERA